MEVHNFFSSFFLKLICLLFVTCVSSFFSKICCSILCWVVFRIIVIKFFGWGIVGFCSDSRDAWSLFLFGLIFGGLQLHWLVDGSFPLKGEAVWFGVWKPVVPLGGLEIILVSDEGVFVWGDCIYGIMGRKVLYRVSYSWVGLSWEGGSTIFLASRKGMFCMYLIFRISFFSFPCSTEPRVSWVISITVSIFKLFAGGFWVVWTILSILLYIFFLVHRFSWCPNFY